MSTNLDQLLALERERDYAIARGRPTGDIDAEMKRVEGLLDGNDRDELERLNKADAEAQTAAEWQAASVVEGEALQARAEKERAAAAQRNAEEAEVQRQKSAAIADEKDRRDAEAVRSGKAGIETATASKPADKPTPKKK